MPSHILNIKDYRKVNVNDYIRKGNKTWDLLLTINDVPFQINDFKILTIKREKVEVAFASITHNDKSGNEEKCLFCGQKLSQENCPKITEEMDTLFYEKIIPQIEKDISFSEIILSDVDENVPMKEYQDKSQPVSIKAAGISPEGVMLFVVRYKSELVMLKEYVGEGSEFTVPTVLFESEEENDLYVHLEFLMPENFINILLEVENFLAKEDEKKEIFDIMGVGELEFWQFAKNREERK